MEDRVVDDGVQRIDRTRREAMKRKVDENAQKIDKKQHPLRQLYPAARAIIKLVYIIFPERDHYSKLRVYEQLYTGEDAEYQMELDRCRLVSLIMMLFLITAVLAGAYLISQIGREGNFTGLLTRPESGREVHRLYLEARGEKREIEIAVNARRRQGEELGEYFNSAFKYIEKVILLDNESAQSITSPLKLIAAVPGTDITVKYTELDTDYIARDGTIKNHELTEEVMCSMLIELDYFEETAEYYMFFNICPAPADETKAFYSQLDKTLEEINSTTVYDLELKLPQEMEGQALLWSEEENLLQIIIVLGIVMMLAVPLAFSQERKRRLEERKAQLMSDYANLINKLMLLLSAGLTVRGAWERMCQDYVSRGSEKRYAYEEMLISRNELQLGISQQRVIEDFGKRCGLAPYQKLCSIIVQNIKHGSKGILPMLETEALDAFAQRREQARRLGEEAGTKLLFPMMLMLLLVMAVIMVPALISF